MPVVPFTAEAHSRIDKSFTITGPSNLSLEVDYDDVPHAEVDILVERLLEVLNTHWPRGGIAAKQCRNDDCDAHWDPVVTDSQDCPACDHELYSIMIR